MRTVVDIGKFRINVKNRLANKIFNWIDVRNNFHNLGINLIEDLLKYDNIGFFTNSLKTAIRIREINKQVQIMINHIDNIEQALDLVMNNIILVVSEYSTIDKLLKLNLDDKIQIAVQIDINNYEGGVSPHNYKRIKEMLQNNKKYEVTHIFAITNCVKYNNLEIFKDLVLNEQIKSFILGADLEYVSDGFISKELSKDIRSYQIIVDKCFALNKKDFFINKRIKSELFGIKLFINGINLTELKYIIIDDIKYHKVWYGNDCLYITGKKSVKVGKKVDITSIIPGDYNVNWPIIYKLNDKTIDLNLF